MGSKSLHRMLARVPAFLVLFWASMRAATEVRTARFRGATSGAASMASIGTIVLAVVVAVLVPLVVMDALADTLPDYFTSLGGIFTALAAINTTGWPPIVATLFDFVPLILGVTAIGGVFGLGALLIISVRRKSTAV